jgi:preprotein translocase subunit YajC
LGPPFTLVPLAPDHRVAAAVDPMAVPVHRKEPSVKGLLPVVLIVAVFYVVLIVPQARKRKQAQALQRTVEPGAKVMLASGMYGTIHDVEDNALIVEIADGVRVRFAKASVLRVLPEESTELYDPDPDETDEPDDDPGHDHDHDREADHDADPRGDTHGAGADDGDTDDSDGHDGAAGPVSRS